MRKAYGSAKGGMGSTRTMMQMPCKEAMAMIARFLDKVLTQRAVQGVGFLGNRQRPHVSSHFEER